MLGRPAREVASYPSDETRVPLERRLLETGWARGEFRADRKGSTPAEVELIAVAVKDDRGEITGYLGIPRDITERKRAEQRESRAGQQALGGLRALVVNNLQTRMDEAVGLVAGTLDVGLAAVAEMPPGDPEMIVRAGVGRRECVIDVSPERRRAPQAANGPPILLVLSLALPVAFVDYVARQQNVGGASALWARSSPSRS